MERSPRFGKPLSARHATLALGLFSAALGHAQLTLTLTPSDHHGYHISCFGGGDGAIDLSVTGGTPPYTYAWSTGATTQDVSGLRAGYVSVNVRDAASGSRTADLTLTEPYELRADVQPYLYGSGFNISCYNCYNGSIQVTTYEGVAPYSYAWADGPDTEDRTQLDAGIYEVEVTDVNGCVFREDKILLTQPERDDWSKSGNAGSDPNTQFLGTTDNKDVVFKSNGTERLRLVAGGDIKFPGLASTDGGMLKIGTTGILSIVGPNHAQPAEQFPYWRTNGNFIDAADGSVAFIGTRDNKDFLVRTNDHTRLVVPQNGGLNIGAEDQVARFHVSPLGDLRLLLPTGETGTPLTVERGQGDYLRFQRSADSSYWAIHNGNTTQDHLAFHFIVPGGQSLLNRLVLWNNGKVTIGDTSPGADPFYLLYVEGGVATRDVMVKLGDWPDFVFRPAYHLMPLDELRTYLRSYGHLPGLPSAAEVDAKGGFEVGEVQKRTVTVIEEQALYILQLQERLEAMEQRLKALEASKH